jgi:hypothetical protein
VHQVVQVRRVEAETVGGHAADESGTGLVGRVIELPAAGILAELLLVPGSEERALVMVEPRAVVGRPVV